MKTYNDLAALGDNEKERIAFLQSAISDNQSSDEYKIASDAALYYRHQNPNIMRLERFIHDAYGRTVPDVYSPNHRIPSTSSSTLIT